MKKILIGIFTTTRAEFGILSTLIKHFKKNKKFNIKLLVGGSHFLKSFGNTNSEIIENKFKIDNRFGFVSSDDSILSTSLNLSQNLRDLGKIFKKYKFDYVCVLGDRYETIPIVLMSIISNKKIIHIGGGEETTGVIDNKIRNMLSQAATFHFTIAEKYKKALIKSQGISVRKVFNVGALSVDKIKEIKFLNKKEIFEKLLLDQNKETILLNYHPETTTNVTLLKKNFNQLFNALNKFDYQTVITSPNLEVGSGILNKIIKTQLKKNKKYRFFKSLGFLSYHSLLRQCEFVIGNSSSGIVEAPFYKIPSINIGLRQKGRMRHRSVIDTDHNIKLITRSINKAKEKRFLREINNINYKFGDGTARKKIEKILLKSHNA